MTKLLTAAELWDELSDTEKEALDGIFVCINGEVWRVDDLDRCDECGKADLEVYVGDDGAERCAGCHYDVAEAHAEARSLHAWATHVRSV